MLKDLKNFNLPQLEERVLKFWRNNHIFEQSLKNRQGKKNFVFYEGPPTANGRPGTHHVLARVFKDVFLRYKTMRGFYVQRRAGWDTQGLPVEIEVEKELGLKNKQEIERYGIAKFNKRSRQSVWKYKDEWERLTERIGFWLDFNKAYVTYENSYLEKLWGIIKTVDKRKLLKKFYKVVPYCVRCQTTLSSHELGQPEVYREVSDPSVFIKFKLKGKRNEFLLVWTTTPWTLPANIAVAINPKLTYKKFKVGGDYLWAVNEPLIVGETKIEETESVVGKKLLGKSYEPLYKNKGKHKVYAADFVEAAEGTGVVHLAPFGEDDLELMKKEMKREDMPITVDDQGRVAKSLPGAGKFIKDADFDILADLEKRNLLYHKTTIKHEYPFCWRCSQLLIYYPRLSWFIEMSKLRAELAKANQNINWLPEYVKDGRFGNWLAEVKDWAISRERYWGTPLPIWECEKCANYLVVGGLDDLNKNAFYKNNYFIVRHGEADHNLADGLLAGDEKNHKPSQLTEAGVKQAEKMAKDLKKKKIGVIYCSPFERTKKTAEIINKQLKKKIVYDERLSEINFGIFSGKPEMELHNAFKDKMQRFARRPQGGENWLDVKRRVADFIKEINSKHNGENILIVSHGDPLWLLEAALRGISNKQALIKKADLMPGVGEFREFQFNNWPLDEGGRLDLHRPYIDEVILRCAKCKKGQMRRVREVADVWLDSGAMPFASEEYPERFPADYICEAMDQTRGWFYTLLAVSALMGEKEPYKNVISLGLILDKNGQKMSKSRGNAVDPWQLINQHGVDAVRWYFYSVNQPGDVKKFDAADVGKVFRKMILILYNSYKFYEIYADNHSELKSRRMTGGGEESNHILDKWIIARYNQVVGGVVKNMDNYHIYEAARDLEGFVDDLSRWYIRRSRGRLSLANKNSKNKAEKNDYEQASATLGFVLGGLAKLLAPFTPFFSEALFLSFSLPNQASVSSLPSVHLTDYPAPNLKLIDKKLLEQMAEARRLASLVLAKRAELKIKVRQPLSKLKIKKSKIKINDELLDVLADEVNVKKVIYDDKIKEEIELDDKITPVLKREGQIRELARMVQQMRQEMDLRPQDEINLVMHLPEELEKYLSGAAAKSFKKDVNAKELEFKKPDRYRKESVVYLDGQKIWLGVKA